MSGSANASRWLPVATAVLVAVAFAGFLTGARPPQGRPSDALPSAARSGERAPSYAELRNLARGPNANLYAGTLGALRRGLPGLFDPVPGSAADRAQALDARSASRAFDGAPPTVPHRIDELAAPDCLGCHESGARVAGRTAPAVCHDVHASCVQCHVAGIAPDAVRPAAMPHENDFVGLAAPLAGGRAGPGAPPTIPHATLMRERCNACHGVSGRLGLRTPHPYQLSCTQCHAPSAALDQRPVGAAGP